MVRRTLDSLSSDKVRSVLREKIVSLRSVAMNSSLVMGFEATARMFWERAWSFFEVWKRVRVWGGQGF